MRMTLALVLVVLLGVTVSALAADTTIVPGQGIGPVRLGENLIDVVKMMGNPKTTGLTGSTDGITRYRWYDFTSTSATTSSGDGGLFVDAVASGTITRVGVFLAPQYRLENGLHTRDRHADSGSHEADVVRLMGRPQSTTSLKGLRETRILWRDFLAGPEWLRYSDRRGEGRVMSVVESADLAWNPPPGDG